MTQPGLLFLLAACGMPAVLAAVLAPSQSAGDPLDPLAVEYVRLVLAVGRHDPNYVDAYYGPADWREEAARGEPRPAAALRGSAASLVDRLRAQAPGERREFLLAQAVAVETFLRRLTGERLALDDEARLLYDLQPPLHPEQEFDEALARLEEILPGDGPLAARVEGLRTRFSVAADRLDGVAAAILALTRERTRGRVRLPEGEDFRIEMVTDKPWSAYNWYQGSFRSLIEVNTDLPVEIRPILGTLTHEGYPGHHTHNVLLEWSLVRGRGWVEHTVSPLFSPQSLIAEGVANAGLSVIFSEDDLWAIVREQLAPLAGLPQREAGLYRSVLEALRPLRYVRGEAARLLLDGGRSDDDVAAFLGRFGLLPPARARQALQFIRTYRSYVFNYTAGEDLVREYIGEGPGRTERFFHLLQRPVTPSGLRRALGPAAAPGP